MSWLKLIICLLAGMGAGLGTGFAGLSAAAVISPLLIAFLGIEPYEAIGIALASDVLASGVSSLIYWKNKNIDIKNGIYLMVTVLVMTAVGSFVAKFVPSTAMGNISYIMTGFLGLKFIIRPITKEREAGLESSNRKKIIKSVLCGIYIGFVCGFMGAGGGMMMLFALTLIIGYDLKTAVGTSVFVMTFTAFTGSVSHFLISGKPDMVVLILCVVFTFIFARIAAGIANKAKPITLNRLTGGILVIIAVAVLISDYVL